MSRVNSLLAMIRIPSIAQTKREISVWVKTQGMWWSASVTVHAIVLSSILLLMSAVAVPLIQEDKAHKFEVVQTEIIEPDKIEHFQIEEPALDPMQLDSDLTGVTVAGPQVEDLVDTNEKHPFEEPGRGIPTDENTDALAGLRGFDFHALGHGGSVTGKRGLGLGIGTGTNSGSGDNGKGFGRGGGGAQFFGSKSKGKKFVFVVDNSNSMIGGRFETALNELMKSVDGMSKNQSFYVIFFSDTAYGLFHPQAAKTFVPATAKNKERLRAWLYTVELCWGTNAKEAMARAIGLKPDVVYLLGDGAFTDNTQALLTGELKGEVVVNTLGMEARAKDRTQFEEIAKANSGTFKDVGVSPEAELMAKQNPLRRNKKRGLVWGLTLPK